MKRVNESEANYQSKKKAKEENIKKNVVILKFVKLLEMPKCMPSLSESTQGSSGVANHKLSTQHNENFCKWKKEKTSERTNNLFKKEQKLLPKETEKWHEVLTRMLEIQFLAKQNLVLQEDDISTNRGNFLVLLHLLAKYGPAPRDPVLSLMSPQIQNEFIEILGNKVRQVIIARVQKAKYYSTVFDSTPDTF
ncbi:hypothetical protein TNCT_146351 [Trichonephila clavata]|uniref:DUF4371 domain-containing protein n=1 Tax=Trichonephila clavata TaxID=2740835 RepID=A0A8X6H453_TRICU|nr:hypothetical protein TNCT_146351 [Trichonephila clavata]